MKMKMVNLKEIEDSKKNDQQLEELVKKNDQHDQQLEELVKKSDQQLEELVKTEFSKFETRIEETIKKNLEKGMEARLGVHDADTKAKLIKIVEDVGKQRDIALAKVEKDKAEKDALMKEKDAKKEVLMAALAKTQDVADCPSCHSHVHKTVEKGTRTRCVGPDCGKEYEMVDMTSDLKCAGCGAPIKSDNIKGKDDGCPFCSGKKAMKYRWVDLWNKSSPKKESKSVV